MATRRQSIAGLPAELQHGNTKTNDKNHHHHHHHHGGSNRHSSSASMASSSAAVVAANATTTTHALRTRLSVPLSNKTEKR